MPNTSGAALLSLALVGACSLASARPARAQGIGDVVRSHVKDELADGDEKKPKKKPEPKPEPKPKPAKPAAASKPRAPTTGASKPPDGAFVLSTDAPARKGPKLPIRVIGDNLKIDLVAGGGYRGWVPQDYPTVDVDAGSYWVWTIDVTAKIYRFLNLRRGYYESNGLKGPRTEEAAVASQVGEYVPKAAWLLGVVGFPITKAWEPILRYETRSFHTVARPKQPVCVVTASVADDLSTCAPSTAPLHMISGFETFVAGVRYDKAKQSSAVLAERTEKMPPLSFGIGVMQYRKPYQVTVGDSTLEDYIFDGHFRGAGLYFGTEVGGGPERLFLDVDSQVGLGEVELVKSLTLNSLAPEDWLIGYVQGTATVGYYLPLLRSGPTLMFVPKASGGGASFFFFKAKQKSGEKTDSETVNWDILWSVHVALVLSL